MIAQHQVYSQFIVQKIDTQQLIAVTIERAHSAKISNIIIFYSKDISIYRLNFIRSIIVKYIYLFKIKKFNKKATILIFFNSKY